MDERRRREVEAPVCTPDDRERGLGDAALQPNDALECHFRGMIVRLGDAIGRLTLRFVCE
jgi:hypothetical protein